MDDGPGKEALRGDLRDALSKKIGPAAAVQFEKEEEEEEEEEEAVKAWEEKEYNFWRSIPPGTPMSILRPFRPDAKLFDLVQSQIDAKEHDIAGDALKQLKPEDIEQLSKDVEDFNSASKFKNAWKTRYLSLS